MEALLSKAAQRLGRKKVWLVVHVIRTLDSSQRSAADVREALRGIHVYMDDADFATIAQKYAPGDAPFNVNAFVHDFLALLSSRRRHVVDLVLRTLDPNATGFISFDTLKDAYDTLRHPHRLTRREPAELAADFLANFEEAQAAGGIAAEELVAFYLGVSLGMPRDEDFELRCIRSFSLDRPRPKFEEEEVRAADCRRSVHRSILDTQHHPLYTTTSRDYGKDAHLASYDGRFGRSHVFTKTAVTRHKGGATSMNM